MKEKIKKMPGRIRNYFCSHMSAQVTVTVVLLLILAGLVLQIYVKNQYFNYLLRNTRSMEESMIETSTINIDANLKDIISAACNVGVNETLRVLVETRKQTEYFWQRKTRHWAAEWMILLIRLEVLYLLQLYQMKVCGRSMGFIGTRHLQKEYGKMAIWINFRKYMKRPWHFRKRKQMSGTM